MDEDQAIEVIPGLNAPEEPEETAEVETIVAEAVETAEVAPAEKYVPLAALHEERQRRKELAQEIETIKRQHQDMLEAMRPKPEPPPDITIDPVTNIDQRLREQESFRAEQTRLQSESHSRQQAESQEQAFIGDYQRAAHEFTRTAPDFQAAYEYAIKTRRADLISTGLDQETADYMALNEERFLVGKAFADGANPAERIYKLAAARGYRKTANEGDKLAQIEKGLQSKTLSGAGVTPNAPNSLEALNAIGDDAEFLKAFQKFAS